MQLKREDGAAAVEFALVLPILIVLVFGIIEFGLALYNKEVITNASREGARAGIVQATPRPTTTYIEGVAKDYLKMAAWDESNASVSVTIDPDPPGTPGACGSYPNPSLQPLKVKVDYPYSFSVLPNFIAGISKNITLSATTVMKCE
jgi:Flp pilus assembly protein TadG